MFFCSSCETWPRLSACFRLETRLHGAIYLPLFPLSCVSFCMLVLFPSLRGARLPRLCACPCIVFSLFFSPVPSRRNASAVSRRPRTSRPRPRRAIGACWIDRDWRRHTCPACSIAPLHVTCHVVQRARGQALLLSRCTGAALCVPRIISLLYLCPLRSLVWRSSGPVALPCLSLLSRGAPSTCSPPWPNWSCPV